MKLVHKLLTTEIDPAAGTFEAIAWPYDEADRLGDVIQRGAFAKSLARLAAAGTAMPLLWDHDRSTPIGALPVLEDTNIGLKVCGELELSIEKAQQAYSLAKRKALSLSVCFAYQPEHVTQRDGIRYFSEVDLLEISLVTVPAHSGAVITEIKSFDDCQNVRDFESLVRDALGLSRRAAKRLAAVGYPALTERDAPAVTDDVDPQQIIKALNDANLSIQKEY